MINNKWFSKLFYLTLVLCLMSTTAIIGCQKESPTTSSTTNKPSTPQYGGILRIRYISESNDIGYPPTMRGLGPVPIIESLLRYDSKGGVVPWLAESYKTDVTAKTITLSLHKGVKFHDGTDFNSQVVKWNLEEFKNAKMSGTENIKSVDVIDDYTARINMIVWDNTFLGRLATLPGMMISPTAFKQNGKDWAVNHPVGTGPFELDSWEKGIKTTYKKFSNYWQKGKPYLDRIEGFVMENDITGEMGFRAGEVDFMQSKDIQSMIQLKKDGYNVLSAATGSGVVSIIPNSAVADSPWSNIKVRQAAAYAIDTKAITGAINFGLIPESNQWANKGNWAYNPSVVGYPYNPQKAKQLIVEAGYPNGFKTSAIFQNAPSLINQYTSVQSYLKVIGINVELQGMEKSGFDNLLRNKRTWDGLAHGSMSPDPDTASEMLRRLGEDRYYPAMLRPDDFVKAIKNAIIAPDDKAMQQHIWEAQKILIDKYCLIIPVYENIAFVAIQSYVHNTGLLDTPNSNLWTPEEAWINKK